MYYKVLYSSHIHFQKYTQKTKQNNNNKIEKKYNNLQIQT